MTAKEVLKQLKQTRPKQYEKDMGITRERLEDLPPIPLTPEEIARGRKPRQPRPNFRYYYVDTGLDISAEDLARINGLGIPPAYNFVWISTDANTHLQATAKDDKNRTQYRYHTKHTLKQDHKKYARVIQFMKHLPNFHSRVKTDSSKSGFSKNTVIAWMFRIMEEINIRIGNDCYAKENKSYGLSTLLINHVFLKTLKIGEVIQFRFLGKSKQRHTLTLKTPEAVKFVKDLMNLRNNPDKKEALFQCRTPAGDLVRVKSDDLNTYLHQTMGNQFSCKDFRTYAANKFFLEFVRIETTRHPPTTDKQKKLNLRKALDKAAEKLGHNPSISKKSYVKYLSDMYMENPERFANKNKSIDELLIELFTLAIKENKQIGGGTWVRVYRCCDLF
tara:strand:- start:48 stop:1214 length:1167 start_codon:yes stop_codon:yes gene_type:complete